jgi:GTP cyclohydrolase I
VTNLPDVQNRVDTRGIAIDKVGVSKFFLPAIYENQKRVMGVSAYVSLPHISRGANFSRFIITATKHFSNKEINSQTIVAMLQDLKEVMQSEDAYVDLDFDYLMEKKSPVTKIGGGYQNYKLGFIGLLKDGKATVIRRFEIVAASLCPCSKEMSLLENLFEDSNKPLGDCDLSAAIEGSDNLVGKVGMGAHNQRVNIRVDVEFNNEVVLDTKEIIEGLENCASSEVYPILKRPDEKWVTEKAYSRPRFVEDVIREIATYLDSNYAEVFNGYSLKCVANESIHQHNAISYLSKNWKLH